MDVSASATATATETTAAAAPSVLSQRLDAIKARFETIEGGAKQAALFCKDLMNQIKDLRKETVKILEKADRKKEKKKVTHAPRTLSPEFVQFFGAGSNQMTRSEAVKLISDWVKSHSLGKGNRVDVASSDKAKSLHQFLQLDPKIQEIRYIDFQGLLNRFILDKPAEKPAGAKKRKAADAGEAPAAEKPAAGADAAEPAKKKRALKKKDADAASAAPAAVNA